MRRPVSSWRWARRSAQASALAFFALTLFFMTRSAVPPAWVHAFFIIDPLIAVATMAEARAFVPALLPALIVVALTLVFARGFCGWVCPMGGLLDGIHRLLRFFRLPRRLLPGRWAGRVRWLRFGLLGAVLAGAAVGLPLVGQLDPFPLLYRGLMLGGISLAALALVIGLETLERRFWCRNLCPLGALLGLIGRFSLARRRPAASCPNCGQCAARCRMHAFDERGKFHAESCVLCMECVAECEKGIVRIGLTSPRPLAGPPVFESRRRFLAAASVSIALPVLVRWAPASPAPALRPPGADPADFLDRCTRCGLCIRACPTGGLRPALLEQGVAGLFAPALVPRIGHCDYDCNACGTVCPTDAIPRLSLEAKRRAVIGTARFDPDHCVQYLGREDGCEGQCMAACPLPADPGIAIEYQTRTVRLPDGVQTQLDVPVVLAERCIGCGRCERSCPLPAAAGVRVGPRQRPA